MYLAGGSDARLESRTITLSGDLDGDGSAEEFAVRLIADQDRYGQFEVAIKNVTFKSIGDYLSGDARIVDVDANDRWREIAVPQLGPSNDDSALLLRYDGKKIELVGHVPGENPVFDGSGAIATKCRGKILCTWWYPSTYRWSDAAQVFVEVPQPFKPMSIDVTLRHSLEIAAKPAFPLTGTQTLPPGTRATIDLTDDELWCRIRTANAQAGWFRVQDGRVASYPAGVPAAEMFGGLPLAD